MLAVAIALLPDAAKVKFADVPPLSVKVSVSGVSYTLSSITVTGMATAFCAARITADPVNAT
ncbi:hypothetical protein D3C87_1819230 [compost metagenome]